MQNPAGLFFENLAQISAALPNCATSNNPQHLAQRKQPNWPALRQTDSLLHECCMNSHPARDKELQLALSEAEVSAAL
jgi:hypothetical protein